MCVSPIKLPNPSLNGDFFTYERGIVRPTNRRLTYRTSDIKVPCGKCVECKNAHYSSFIQRAQMESLTSYCYMLTFTYDDEHIPHLSFTSDYDNVKICYSDVKHFQDAIKRLRPYFDNIGRDFRYFAVTEYGSARFRPHFHVLLFVSKLDTDNEYTPHFLEKDFYTLFRDEWRINVGSRRAPIYEPLFRFATRVVNGKTYANYDCHLVTDRVDDDTDSVICSVKYLLGYMFKPNSFEEYLMTFYDKSKEYLPEDISRKLFSLLKCRAVFSKGFGFGFDTSTGRKVQPSLAYSRGNSFVAEFWRVYNSLPESFDDFTEFYDEKLYNGLISSFLNHFRKFDKIQDLLNLSNYELIYFVAIYKYQRDLFVSLIKRYGCDQETFNLSLFPLSKYDSTFESSVTYKRLRSMVVESFNYRNPFIGYRMDTKDKSCFVPLCKYFRKYVTTENDYIHLLDTLGYDSVNDIVIELSELSKITKKIDFVNSKTTEITQQIMLRSKKNALNFAILQNSTIFAPTHQTIVRL